MLSLLRREGRSRVPSPEWECLKKRPSHIWLYRAMGFFSPNFHFGNFFSSGRYVVPLFLLALRRRLYFVVRPRLFPPDGLIAHD